MVEYTEPVSQGASELPEQTSEPEKQLPQKFQVFKDWCIKNNIECPN